MPDIKDLKFLRLIIAEAFNAIPRALFESIKEIDSDTIERIYANSADIMTIPVVDQKGVVVGRLPAPSVWIAIMLDIAKEVKGFVWMEFDVIEQRVFIQAYAVAKDYQSSNGEVIRYVVDYIKGLQISEEMKNNIQSATTRPKALEKIGWKRSKRVLMELCDVEFKITEPDDKGRKERLHVPD